MPTMAAELSLSLPPAPLPQLNFPHGSSPRAPLLRDCLSHSQRKLSFRRRPNSVFSRRGTDTPVHQINLEGMVFAAPAMENPPRTPKKWRLGKGQPKPAEKRGCELRAVPPSTMGTFLTTSGPPSPVYNRTAEGSSHAAVDAAMAVSPNDEILHNISRVSPVEPLCSSAFSAYTVSPPASPKAPKKGKSKATEVPDVIGVWRDGKVYWETDPNIQLVKNATAAFNGPMELDSQPIIREASYEESLQAKQYANLPRDSRPKIQVVIPLTQKQWTKPPVGPPPSVPAPSPPSAAKAAFSRETSPPSLVSPPSVTNETRIRNSIVSPMANQTPKAKRQLAQATVPVFLEQVPEHAFADSPTIPIQLPTPKRPVTPIAPSASSSSSSIILIQKNNSVSSSSNGSTDLDDEGSNYSASERTSMTSIDSPDRLGPSRKESTRSMLLGGRTVSAAFSIITPAAAGIFEEPTPISAVTQSLPSSPVDARTPKAELNKPLPPEPQADLPWIEITRTPSQVRPSSSSSSLPSLKGSIKIPRKSSKRNPRACTMTVSLSPDEAAKPEPRHAHFSPPPSPTLSQAADDLDQLLTTITDDAPSGSHDRSCLSARPVPIRNQSDPDLGATNKTPDRRRQVSLPVSTSFYRVPMQHIAAQQYEEVAPSSPQIAESPAERQIAPSDAEQVIRKILESFDSLDDLFSCALVNKGFFRVFKRYELPIMRTVMRNMSPPAWEFRETCPPYVEDGREPSSAAPPPDYTPLNYLSNYYRDAYVIDQIKMLVLQRCHSFLRPETVSALAGGNPKFTARLDDALWRIWTFCKIFGCGKGREDDIVGQMDWLRGGPLVHQGGCRATIMSSDSVDMSNALMNASDDFARGNPGGLTAEQLYDMTEMWNCMAVLLSGFDGRTEQARTHGVYDNTDIRGGDIDGEDMMLQEWVHYTTTLGLNAILSLAATTDASDPGAFVTAAENGWMSWTPPSHDGSRSTFLKEALARIYEEKISAMVSSSPERRQEMREVSRQRIAAHKAELRNRKMVGGLRTVRMSQERPISDWETVFANLLHGRNMATSSAPMTPRTSIALPSVPEMPAEDVGGPPSMRAGAGSLHSVRSAASLAPSSVSPPSVSSFESRRPSFIAGSGNDFIHPALRDQSIHPALRHQALQRELQQQSQFAVAVHPAMRYDSARTSLEGASEHSSDGGQGAAMRQHPRQAALALGDANAAENTAERAVFRIVEMGFTPEEAKMALMRTDAGDGLRIDRAVELLLRA